MNFKNLLIVIVLFFCSFSINAQDFKSLFKKANKEYKNANYKNADLLLTDALAINPDNYNALLLHGKTLYSLEKFSQAASKYAAAIKIEPKDREIQIVLIECYILSEDFEKAEKTAFIYLENSNNNLQATKNRNLQVLKYRTLALIHLKDFPSALEDCKKALQIDKSDYYVMFLKAVATDSIKDYEGARLIYEKAIVLLDESKGTPKPIHQPYFFNLGVVYCHLGLYDLSLASFKRAIKVDPEDKSYPKDYILYASRSKTFLSKKEYSDAISDLNKSIAANNQYSEAFEMRAKVYHQTSQFLSAISDYTKALFFTEKFEYYKGRGECYYELGQYENALKDYKSAALIHPGDAELKLAIETVSKQQYESTRESIPPFIKLTWPLVDSQGFINLSLEQQETILLGEIKDQSLIKTIKVNGEHAVYTKSQLNPEFSFTLKNKSTSVLEIVVRDVYDNENKVNYKVGKVLSDAKLRFDFSGKIIGEGEKLEPLANLTIFLLNKKGEKVAETKTDLFGNFVFLALPYDKSEFVLMPDTLDTHLHKFERIIIADKNDIPVLIAENMKDLKAFKFDVMPYNPTMLSLMSVDDVPLNINIKGKLVNGDDYKTPLADYTIHLINEKGEIVDTKKTDAFGAFLFSRISKSSNYSVKLDIVDAGKLDFSKVVLTDEKGTVIQEIGKNHFGEFSYKILPADQFYLSSITEEDPWMRVRNLGKKKKELAITENIYYESGKWSILPEAQIVLEKVISVLKENPKVTITVESHTDSQASDDFNLELSNKRANAVAEHLIKAGVDKMRITGKGYGETQLTNRCANEVDCSSIEHGQNRRTVFQLIYKE
ncbi:MAG: tetratricopeptide repeat protein [Bacteroidetes bacterium]|nr:tetratricopeptide repeat protein [Bacteroidota bacterium]HET6244713.1 tetratricopeptide repeat protein [Bacteroidia bacterium]